LLMLQASCYPDMRGGLMQTAQKLGIPERTLRRWHRNESNPTPDNVVEEKRIDFVAAIRAEITAILGAMENERSEASYRELGTVFGIMVDKMQLLTNQPTSRTEVVTAKDRALEAIRRGEVPYDDLAKTHGESLAQRWFAEAGVKVDTGS
jgi:hypothetical protein